jgi:DNA-directed RNA polymerase specialized sigma24 family protein
VSVQARLERQQRFDRERAVLRMRSAVVAAVAREYLGRVGSSAVLDAVDEALAQIVAAGAHLGELDQVKALWITAARRRVIDEQRSAESRHRGVAGVDAGSVSGPLADMTDDGSARWRIHEILSVLRGDQRRWADVWFDEVLSSTRRRGGHPRGLSEALGWTPAKTKSVSRRARMKMAEFIEARVSGDVCGERRAHLDAFIMAERHGYGLGEERHAAVLLHVAGCEDCQAAWHARRRELLGRRAAVAVVPVDAMATTVHAFAEKLVAIAVNAQSQASWLLMRAGIGGTAAAGGGAVTLSGKTAAVCAGLVCATAAGGEIAVVLAPTRIEPERSMPVHAVPVLHAEPAVHAEPAEHAEAAKVQAVRRRQRDVAAVAPPPPPPRAVFKARVHELPGAVPPAIPGDLPPADEAPGPVAPPPAVPRFREAHCTPGSFAC